MKRTRLFLEITTVLLAIVGIVSAKVTQFGGTHLGYFKRGTTIFTTITGCLKAANMVDICTGAVKTVGSIIFTNSAATHPLTYSNPND